MASVGDIVGGLVPTGQSTLTIVIWVLIGFALLALIVGVGYFFVWQRRKWNLKVEIKLTRADGQITNGEWGKGFYDSVKGVVFIKRPYKGAKKVAMKIFDVRKYMQGTDMITVLQVGPEDYRPVLNSSWSEHEVEYIDETRPKEDADGNELLDEEGNKVYHTTIVKESVLNIRTETGKNKAWKAAWEEAAKNAYTIQSFLRQYQTPIAIGIVILCCFVGFAILWTKLSGVCG